MNSIKIYTGGYFNEYPIKHNSTVIGINSAILSQNEDLFDTFNFFDYNGPKITTKITDPKMNALKLLNLIQMVADEYRQEIKLDEQEEKRIQSEIDELHILPEDIIVYEKDKEVKGLESRIAKLSSSSGAPIKPKKGVVVDTVDTLSLKLAEIKSELSGLKKLSADDILQIKKREGLIEKLKVPRKAKDDKLAFLDRIEKYMDENLDEDKLKCEIEVLKSKIADIIKTISANNERFELFQKIIDYLKKSEKVDFTDYPDSSQIKCEDLSGKGLGWFVNQRKQMGKDYNLENEEKKLKELSTKLDLVKTVSKIDIDDSTFNSKLDRYNYKINKINQNFRYDNVFDILSGFSIWGKTFFPSLNDGDQFIIVERHDGDFFEIYRSNDVIDLTKDKVYQFDRSTYIFSYLKTFKDFSKIKQKKIVYPVLYSPTAFEASLIDGLILYSKNANLPNYTRYYKYINDKEKVTKWINKYCALVEDRQHIYHTAPSPFITCILSNLFKEYYQIMQNTDYELEDDEYFAPDYAVNLYLDKLDEDSMKNFCSNIDSDFEKIEGENNDIKISNLIKKYITSNPDITSQAIVYILKKLKDKHSVDDIDFRFVSITSFTDPHKDTLTSTHNFYTLNYLYSKFKETFKDDLKESDDVSKFSKRFSDRLSDLNTFINYTPNQVYGLFLLEIFDDYITFKNAYYDYKKELSRKYDKTQVVIKVKQCLLDLLCAFYFYLIYEDPKISKLINYEVQFAKFNDSSIPPADSSIGLGIRPRDVKATTTENKEIKVKFLEGYQIVFGGKIDGFINYSYRERLLFLNFPDPRGIDPSPTLGDGRPMCGEVTILNFLNFLLFNKTTKQIDYTYLPDVTKANNLPLTDFYRTYTDIKKYNKDKTLISSFFDFYKHIPFKIIPGIDDKVDYSERYYSDQFWQCVYKFNKQKSSGADTIIDLGIELRVTYFNMVRVLSYVLKLPAPLDLQTIESRYSDTLFLTNALKEIMLLFNNPDVRDITSEYSLDKDPLAVPLNVVFKGGYLMLGRHSEFHLIKASKFADIAKKFNSFPTIFNNKRRFSRGKIHPYDVYSSVFLSSMKDNIFYSELNFYMLQEDDLIKFIKILNSDFEELYINPRVIKTVIQTKKFKLANLFFEKFMLSRDSFTFYFKYALDEGISVDNIMEKYFQKNLRLTYDILTLIIEKNRIDIIKNLISCGKFDKFSYFNFAAIKNQEMFNLIDSLIVDKGTFYQELLTPLFWNTTANTKDELMIGLSFIDNAVFKRLSGKIPFVHSMLHYNKIKNLEIILNKNKEAGVNFYEFMLPSDYFTKITTYSVFELIKKNWVDYSTHETKANIELMTRSCLVKLTNPKITINEAFDIIKLLCHIIEIDESIFESVFSSVSLLDVGVNFNITIDNGFNCYALINNYLTLYFYNKFAKQVSKYILQCKPVCELFIYKIDDRIFDINISKQPDDIKDIIRKMIDEYPKLFSACSAIYEPILLANMGAAWDSSDTNILKLNLTMDDLGPKRGRINPVFLITYYEKFRQVTWDSPFSWSDFVSLNDGSDELTSYIISNLLNKKKLSAAPYGSQDRNLFAQVNDSPYILALIRSYFGYHSHIITKLSSTLKKSDAKYTEEYISKNLIKVFNYALVQKSAYKPAKDKLTSVLNSLLRKFRSTEKFMFKLFKSIIKNTYYGDLSISYYGYNLKIIQSSFDNQIKWIYLSKFPDYNEKVPKTLTQKIREIGNSDLDEIRVALGMH